MKKYAIGDWYHMFGPGRRETRCRIVIDLEQSKLVAAQEWTGLKFVDVLGDRLKDLAESVIEVNQAHAKVEEWAPDPDFADELPEWVSPKNLSNYIEHSDTSKTLDDLYASWDRFADVPVSEDGAIEAPFLHFSVGVERETIWRWFESQNPRFVVGDVMNGIRHEDERQAQGNVKQPYLDPNYQLLGRLQQDCEYYLGNGGRSKKHLWAGDEAAQIQRMKELYEGFREKPEWITPEAIEQYEAAMVLGNVPIPMGQTINATIQAGVLTLPDGQSIDLKQVQSALNFGFQETGDHDLMAAGDLMSKITGVVQGPSGEFVPVGDQQVAEMPTKAADLSNVDSFALQCELERRGLLVQTWSPGDFEFIGNEDDDAADLSDDALEQIQQQAFDQCRRSLDEITTQRGNEHLGDWWAINKEPILAQFKMKDEAPSPGM